MNGSLIEDQGGIQNESTTGREPTEESVGEIEAVEKDELGLPKNPLIGNPNSHGDIIELRNLRKLII